MRIECIAVGTELLTTERVDTNSVWLAARLGELGLAFHRKTAVGDDREDLRDLCREALERSDLVVCTGGLGPTFDDFTKEVWAEILDAPLVEDPPSLAALLAFHAARGRVPSPSNYKQALIPMGAEALANPHGTAPGVLWTDPPGHAGRRIVLLPGVPLEMKHMWDDHVAPRLRDPARRAVHTLRLVFGAVPEALLAERTRELRERHGELAWTILAGVAHVEILARGRDPEALRAARGDFEAALGEDLARVGPGGLEDAVLDLLVARGDTLSVAESMTGGALAARLTSVPGSSRAFLGGVTAYSAAAKVALAGLDPALCAAHGTVSEPVTRALAEAVRARLGTTWALAVTGNAGPAEDREGPAPVGTVLAALAGPGGTEFRAWHLGGGRTDIQTRAVSWALDLLRRRLVARADEATRPGA
jgi:nicotinamide-nucleotide amidase